jgi:hypothetical protein
MKLTKQASHSRHGNAGRCTVAGLYAKHGLVALAILVLSASVSVLASQDTPAPNQAPNLSGLHDFDFLRGDWKAHHRVLKERLAGSHDWVEYDGTVSQRALMDGWANSGDNIFNTPKGTYRGVSLRAYDSKSGLWAVWWLDGRNPFGDIGPPIKGHFENGVGSFYSDDTLRGKPVRVRVTWTHNAPNTAHWEQAFSADGGKTWEINWTTDFVKTDLR